MRSGPETGHLGCVWHTEAADFTAGSRQFADKRSVARSAPTKDRISRTGEASPGPLPHSVFLPAGRRSGLVREGLRSGPETGHLGCVWHTEAADFTAGSRQFADKRSVARSAPTKDRISRTSEVSPGPLPHSVFLPAGRRSGLVREGCGAALKPVTLAVSGTPRRPILLPVPGSSRTSEVSPGPLPWPAGESPFMGLQDLCISMSTPV
ncbi:hypothetical protein CXB34_11040 [Pseudomonas amygdali pv. morsprunorum]|nr:hypothetical protein CXB34_11040 [Pseudomonas amygdali pv. morsprunorum]